MRRRRTFRARQAARGRDPSEDTGANSCAGQRPARRSDRLRTAPACAPAALTRRNARSRERPRAHTHEAAHARGVCVCIRYRRAAGRETPCACRQETRANELPQTSQRAVDRHPTGRDVLHDENCIPSQPNVRTDARPSDAADAPATGTDGSGAVTERARIGPRQVVESRRSTFRVAQVYP